MLTRAWLGFSFSSETNINHGWRQQFELTTVTLKGAGCNFNISLGLGAISSYLKGLNAFYPFCFLKDMVVLVPSIGATIIRELIMILHVGAVMG